MALYGKIYAEVNGTLLVENSSVDVDTENDAQKVTSIAGGFRGISPGVAVDVIKFNSGVPITGPEHDFKRDMLLGTAVALRLSLDNGQSATYPKAYVIGPMSLKSSVTGMTEQGVTLVAEAQLFR